VWADFYGLVAGAAGRVSARDITLFKNGGGAHLDLMISHHLAEFHRD
jgi:ornithine cyclodeaminase